MTWLFAGRWRSPRWRAPLVTIVALLVAGGVLVVHGEPKPVQRNSGVSVPVRSGSDSARAAAPALAVLADGALTVFRDGKSAPLPIPGDPVVLGIQQLTDAVSAALVQRPDGQHAVLLSGGAAGADLGLADRIVPGADPAVVAVQTGSVQTGALVVRYDAAGSAVGAPVTLPIGMSLAADTALGLLASTEVGALPVPSDADAADEARLRAGLTRSALQTGQLWTPLGAYQPMAARGSVAVLWNPLLRQLCLLNLALMAAVEALPAAQLPSPSSSAPAPEPTTGAAGPSDSSVPTGGAVPTGTVSSEAAPGETVSPGDPPVTGLLSGSDASGASSTPVDPTASLAPDVARALLPISYPSLPGVSLTGPVTFSPDGGWISMAGQVGQRPRLVVGQVPSALVRGQTILTALDVIGLGGDLPEGSTQPTPVWTTDELVAARLDGTVALFSLSTRTAVGHELTDDQGSADAPLPQDSDQPSPTLAPSAPAGSQSAGSQSAGSQSAGSQPAGSQSGGSPAPLINGLAPA